VVGPIICARQFGLDAPVASKLNGAHFALLAFLGSLGPNVFIVHEKNCGCRD